MDCMNMQDYLDRYMDEALSDQELTALEAHAAVCEDCAAQLKATRQLKAMLLELPDELDVPLKAQAAWRSAVKAEAAHRRGRRLTRYVGGIAAAIVVMVGIGLMLRPGTHGGMTAVKGMNAAVVEKSAVEDNLNAPAPSLAMVEADSAVPMAEAAESAAAPMREIELTVSDLDGACGYLGDLIREYEGTLDEQRFESSGRPCANLFIEMPARNAEEFLAAACQYAQAEVPKDESDGSLSGGDAVSLLLVLRTE